MSVMLRVCPKAPKSNIDRVKPNLFRQQLIIIFRYLLTVFNGVLW